MEVKTTLLGESAGAIQDSAIERIKIIDRVVEDKMYLQVPKEGHHLAWNYLT